MSASDADALRSEVAAARGLDPGAKRFLSGTTLEEVEASAEAFAQLVGANDRASAVGREEPPSSGQGFFADAMAATAARKQAVAALFAGRAPQPRDEAGRFTKPASFDGGARPFVPPPPPTHDEWLAEVLRTRSADRGASF
jgi:hypothetical protein